MPEYGLTPYPDKPMFSSIRKFQSDHNLKEDGIITPEGETLQKINDAIEEDEPGKSPTICCPRCRGPHGGSKGDLCPDCDSKN